eukprot:Sspe_Gene.41116::Locus_19890_Transcript_1_1_Confidence_1.000_Length_3809::g.41116::m.41116/K20308/TRAPPC11; trafficking protein particle complex subunit 11
MQMDGGRFRGTVSPTLDIDGEEYYYSTERPSPVLGLLGCGELHPQIMEIMGVAKAQHHNQELHNFHVRSLGSEADILPRKDRRGYEGYLPSGILKSGWCRKHQNKVFGCLIVLFNIDAFPDRLAFESDAGTRIEQAKLRLRGRQTRLLVVVVTKHSSPPLYERVEDLTSVLRKKCELESVKNICILNGDITDSVPRMLQLAIDLSHMYYKHEVQRIKKLKNDFNKAAQPQLYARHRFKVGYFYEVLRQNESALKYYGQCYDLLRTVSPDMCLIPEIKAAADITMYRYSLVRLLYDDACKLAPAVKAIQDHMAWYKTCDELSMRPSRNTTRAISISRDSRSDTIASSPRAWRPGLSTGGSQGGDTGSVVSGGGGGMTSPPPESMLLSKCPTALLVHHVAVARQHERYAWVLSQAPRDDRTAPNEYANPGFHYHCSAQAVAARRDLVRGLFSLPAAANPPQNLPPPLYVGQPWGGNWESDALLAELLRKEDAVAYEEEIIYLCSKAKMQYHQQGATNMSIILSCTIGKSYAALEKWDEARTQLEGVVAHFKQRPWPTILDHVLRLSMQCGLKLHSTQFYFQNALYHMGHLPGVDREQLFHHILAWLNREPAGLAALSPLEPPHVPMEFTIGAEHPFVSLTAFFAPPVICMNEECTLNVRMATRCRFPIHFSHLIVEFSRPQLNITHPLSGKTLIDGKPLFLSLPMKFTKEGVVTVSHIRAVLGPQEGGCIHVVREVPLDKYSEIIARLQTSTADSYFGYDEVFSPDLSLYPPFHERFAINVLKPKPQLSLSLSHSPPALPTEAYSLTLNIATGGDEITDGRLVFSGTKFEVVQVVDLDGGDIEEQHEEDGSVVVPLSRVGAGQERHILMIIRSGDVGHHEIPIVVSYDTERCHGQSVQSMLVLDVAHPFSMTTKVVDTLPWHTAEGECTVCLNPSRSVAFSHNFNVVPKQADPVKPPLGSLSPQQLPPQGQQLLEPPLYTPFSASVEAIAGMGKDGNAMRWGETMCVEVTLHSVVSSFEVEVLGVALHPTSPLALAHPPPDLTASLPLSLEQDEEFTLSWMVRSCPPLPTPKSKTIPLGSVKVTARRKFVDDGMNPFADEPVELELLLPEVVLVHCTLLPLLKGPSVGSAGNKLVLSLGVRNQSQSVQELRYTAEEASQDRHLFWAGSTSGSTLILPGQERTIPYALVPENSGMVSLPTFSVTSPEQDLPVFSGAEQLSIFVYPNNTPLPPPQPLPAS